MNTMMLLQRLSPGKNTWIHLYTHSYISTWRLPVHTHTFTHTVGILYSVKLKIGKLKIDTCQDSVNE